MSRYDRPFSHTQYDDRESTEPPCPADRHHWVWDEDDKGSVCTRCGAFLAEDDPE